MRDNAFDEYFKIVYPKTHAFTFEDDDECFEKGMWVGPPGEGGRRGSLVPTPIPSDRIDKKFLDMELPSAPDGFKPNSCVRRQYRSPTPPPVRSKQLTL